MRVATNTEMSNIQSQINQQLAILNRPGAKVEWAQEKYFSGAALAHLGNTTYGISVPALTTFSNRTYQMIACFMGSANPLVKTSTQSNPVLSVALFSGGTSLYRFYQFGWRSCCGINIYASLNQLISGSAKANYNGADTVYCQVINNTGWSLNFQENSPTESKFVVFVVSYLKTTEAYS